MTSISERLIAWAVCILIAWLWVHAETSGIPERRKNAIPFYSFLLCTILMLCTVSIIKG